MTEAAQWVKGIIGHGKPNSGSLSTQLRLVLAYWYFTKFFGAGAPLSTIRFASTSRQHFASKLAYPISEAGKSNFCPPSALEIGTHITLSTTPWRGSFARVFSGRETVRESSSGDVNETADRIAKLRLELKMPKALCSERGLCLIMTGSFSRGRRAVIVTLTCSLIGETGGKRASGRPR